MPVLDTPGASNPRRALDARLVAGAAVGDELEQAVTRASLTVDAHRMGVAAKETQSGQKENRGMRGSHGEGSGFSKRLTLYFPSPLEGSEKS
jgi:hypothetical protein